jgi:hypothetical protein
MDYGIDFLKFFYIVEFNIARFEKYYILNRSIFKSIYIANFSVLIWELSVFKMSFLEVNAEIYAKRFL